MIGEESLSHLAGLEACNDFRINFAAAKVCFMMKE
jgi:hypothetical protein